MLGPGMFLIDVIDVLTRIFEVLILIRILMSWFFRARGVGGASGRIFAFVHTLTEPILGPIRRLLLKSPMKGIARTIDFSPIFALALVRAVSMLLVRLIITIGVSI